MDEARRKGLQGEQLEAAKKIVMELRQRLKEESREDQRFMFALRRYIWKRPEFDERGHPADREKVKFAKVIRSERAMCDLQ